MPEAYVRKLHVRVDQHYYLDMLEEIYPKGYSISDFAIVFDVSYATAYRKMKGLVFQGKIEPRSDGLYYYVP